ncbi:unnamed protein product, partial [Vitis vinifera]|uniref:DUF936 domain-containing protein n=1 Tax=Vitis vinifera TaxID=29760 RepID=D7SSM8_VITVI
MASLTPGVLSKLILNAGNKDVKVFGEHRSALLQVIEIVPSLAGGDDLWQSRGFFLKLSDSLHSAYVSVSDEDVDLISTDKIQLGQFVHVAGLDAGSPVPVLRGIKPIPKRRPCVGNPKDLVSSDLLPIRSSAAKRSVLQDTKSRRASIGNGPTLECLELRRLSLDSARRAWDQSPTPKKTTPPKSSRFKTKQISTSSNVCFLVSPFSVSSDKKASFKIDSSSKRSSVSISPLKSKNEISSPKLACKPLQKDSKFKTWSDQNISWDSLPPRIHDLGKDAASYRNVAFLAAVNALEEASAAEGVIQCMSMFAELCESSQKDSAGPLVEQFLNLHQDMQKAAMSINALLSTRLAEVESSSCCSSQPPLAEACKNFNNKNAISWVQAALETDLSKFCLFRKQDNREIRSGEKCHYIVLENSPEMKSENHSPQNKPSPRNNGGLSDSSAKGLPSPSWRRFSASKRMSAKREEWSKGSGLRETANLAKKLLSVSRGWFLKYLEDSLNKGFGLKREEGGAEIACLLGQLKRVNQWLDGSVEDGMEVDERIEGLRKKLYGFLLEHVDSAVVSGK